MTKPTRGIVSGSEYLALPRAPETWLIEPLIPAGGSVLLYGDPKVGKSYAALQLALAIEGGTEWFGFPVRTNGKVVYVQLDTPRSLWAQRLETLKKDGLPVETLTFGDRETLDCFPFDILNQEHYDLLRSELQQISPAPVAVIIDTLRESHSGDEDKSTSMQPVIAALQSVVAPAALIVIAHSRKTIGDQAPDLINDNRGSSYVAGRMDCIIRFSRHTVYYTGRAVEEGSIRLERTENGLWVPANDDRDKLILAIINDPNLTSTSARAKALSERIGKSEEACRSLIRRFSLSGQKERDQKSDQPTLVD